MPLDPVQGTGEVPSNHKEETREAPSDPDEETREAPSNPEKETLEAPSDSEEETKNVAGLAAGSMDLGGLVVPARRELNTGRNLPPNNVIAYVEWTGARRRGRSSAAKYATDDRRRRRGRRRGEYVDMRRWGLDNFVEKGEDVGADSEGHVIGEVNRQQAMNVLEMGEWRNVRRNN